jgi:hypothetical protein
VNVHPAVAASSAWGYRNRIELSFGARRYLSEADHRAQAPIEGRFLGFHAAGRFDRIVDLDRCEIVDEDVNRLIAATRAVLLRPDGASVWDVRTQSGALKYLQLRHAPSTGELLMALFTPVLPELEPEVELLANALFATPLDHSRLVGVEWVVDEGVADVGRMDLAVHAGLADAPRDQLRDLRAEVEDQDLVVVHGARPSGGRSCVKTGARPAGGNPQPRTEGAADPKDGGAEVPEEQDP